MIAQFFLSALLTLVLIYAWSQYRRSQVIAMLSTGAAAAALYLVWMPSHATFLAERVGIGRGVDLIICTWVVISLLMFINLHIRLRGQMEVITKLAREIAIMKAFPPAKPLSGHDKKSGQDDEQSDHQPG